MKKAEQTSEDSGNLIRAVINFEIHLRYDFQLLPGVTCASIVIVARMGKKNLASEAVGIHQSGIVGAGVGKPGQFIRSGEEQVKDGPVDRKVKVIFLLSDGTRGVTQKLSQYRA